MNNHSNIKSSSEIKNILIILFALFIIGAIGLAIIFTYYGNRPAPLNFEIVAERKAKLADVNAKQNEIISSYTWIDQSKGIVRIPVERAMTLTIEQLLKETAKESSQTQQTSSSDN